LKGHRINYAINNSLVLFTLKEQFVDVKNCVPPLRRELREYLNENKQTNNLSHSIRTILFA